MDDTERDDGYAPTDIVDALRYSLEWDMMNMSMMMRGLLEICRPVTEGRWIVAMKQQMNWAVISGTLGTSIEKRTIRG